LVRQEDQHKLDQYGAANAQVMLLEDSFQSQDTDDPYFHPFEPFLISLVFLCFLSTLQEQFSRQMPLASQLSTSFCEQDDCI
jgi:hypothetical protein